jgi:RNA polymerase sigma-70 factor (sigma-E family)
MDAGFDELYERQWWPMLRLATGLVDDVASAEDVVQDAFANVYRRWGSIADPGGYLRTAVVNAARSALRRRGTERKHLRVEPVWHSDAADHAALVKDEGSAIVRALRALPDRQREVLVLRYLAELTDAEIAAATGLSEGGVRSASSRGLAALRTTMGGVR